MDTSRTLTPATAAQRAGVSRTTIVRALQAGELQGLRDNRGRWNISPEALEDWRKHRARNVQEHRAHTDHSREIAQLRATVASLRQITAEQAAQIARLEAEARAAVARADAATDERDAWRSHAATLAQRGEPPPAQRGRGLRLLRLLGRK